MKVIVLVNAGTHAHCYGVDYIIAGLRQIAVVWVHPQKPNVHLQAGEHRDECNIDSDAWWPRREGVTLDELVDGVDAVLLGFDSGVKADTTDIVREVLDRVPASVPVAALDMGDPVYDQRAFYQALVGRSFAYFKRELPLGVTWGYPCPLTYPAWKALAIRRFLEERGVRQTPHVFYHASDHGGGAPGVPRHVIVDALRDAYEAMGTSRPILDVQLMPSQQDRLSPEEYHIRMAQALIGISWNGALNWDCNRFWEHFAFGLCQVAERPRIQMPHPFVDGEHVHYVTTPEQVAPIVMRMIQDPDTAFRIARAGQGWFLQHHAADRRAQYILDTLGAAGA